MKLNSEFKSKYKVLLFDNDKTSLLLFSQILENDYELFLAEDIYQAINIISHKTIDLVLIDLEASKEAGFNLLSILKQRLNNRIPVVFLIESGNNEAEEECFKLGAQDVIPKGSRAVSILRRLESALELFSLREINYRINQETTEKIESIQQQIIEAFSSIIEGRDNSTGMHIKRTAAYVEMVLAGLEEYGYYVNELTEELKDAIIRSAPLHDIGKIVVSDAILCKPGKLTKEEFEIMKCHTTEGGKLIKETLSDIDNNIMLETAINMATYHHEKWLGGGYPCNLKGEDIPLCARVMAIADVFDALVSKRCYKESFTYDESFKIIENEAGKHFDPKIAEVFLGMKEDVINICEGWSLVT
jgi:putative two-component system response regulator